MYIDKDKLLQSLNEEDIETILQNLSEYKYKKDSHHNFLTCTALCHPNGDSPYKLIIYPNTNSDKEPLVVCMTCGCKTDLVTFCLKAKRNIGEIGNTWYKCLNWIAMITGKSDKVAVDNPNKINKLDDYKWIKRIKSVKGHNESDIDEKEINENILDLFTYVPHEAWLNDGCNEESMMKYDIGYYPPNDQITIPHRNSDGKLIGIRVRNLDENMVKKGNKYMPLQSIEGCTFNHKLTKYLYGWWLVKDYCKQINKVCIVESEKSCLQGYTMFGLQSYIVATCGSNISSAQAKIILEAKIGRVYYAPDRDYHDPHSFEAEAWMNKQILKLEPFILYCQVYLIADTEYRLEYKDSPTDRGLNTFLQLYDEKIEITMEDVNRVKEEMRKERTK